jgi:hypothetical protein
MIPYPLSFIGSIYYKKNCPRPPGMSIMKEERVLDKANWFDELSLLELQRSGKGNDESQSMQKMSL